MEALNQHIGGRIRAYRKEQKMTLQQLADKIHKSRATVSKYENGEITLDIETLSEISDALHVSLSQLTDFRPPGQEHRPVSSVSVGKSPFFQANRL